MLPKEIRHVVSKQRQVITIKPRIEIENECKLFERSRLVQCCCPLSHTRFCSSNEPYIRDLENSMDPMRCSASMAGIMVAQKRASLAPDAADVEDCERSRMRQDCCPLVGTGDGGTGGCLCGCGVR
jgi:hypothetical protein